MEQRMDSKEPQINEKETEEVKIIKFDTNQQFFDQMKSLQYLKNPLSDLASAPSAIVYFGTPCCDLRCCVPLNCVRCVCNCDENFRYTTLIKNGDTKQFLFRNWVTLSCNVLGCDKLCRYKTCKSCTFSSYEDYTNDVGTEFCEMLKASGCTCFGLCSLLFNVNISAEGNRLAGIVKYKGYCEELCSCKDCCKSKGCCDGCCKGCCAGDCCDCCYDYYYCCEIVNPSNETIYYIFLRKCCISCIPISCCSEIIFTIKDTNYSNVGEIKASRNCCSLCGICGTNYTYNIDFPSGATPELKLTITNAAITIDLFVL
jgi:hypothetical protein